MIGAIVRRVGWTLLVVWFVVTATFVVTAAIPADPMRALLGPHVTAEATQRVRAHYCLDRGVVRQYGCWLDRLAHGDLGESYRSKRKVSELIGARLGATAQLAAGALVLQLAIGVPLGVIAAIRRGRWPDRGALVLGLLGQSAPPFFVATVLLYLFAYRWGWFPLGGYGEGVGDRLAHLVLPAATLALAQIALYTRIVRGELIEVLREDYIRTARAKGLPERAVLGRHALRNALGPVVTLFGIDLGALLGGAVVVESVFAWPGLGREVLQAIFEVDIPLIVGVVLVTAFAIAIANLLADLAYLWLDPRLRESA